MIGRRTGQRFKITDCDLERRTLSQLVEVTNCDLKQLERRWSQFVTTSANEPRSDRATSMHSHQMPSHADAATAKRTGLVYCQ
jgi:hypothetical protein